MKVKDWIARIEAINNYLPLMQTQNNRAIIKLSESQLKDIVAKNLPRSYQIMLPESGLDPAASLTMVQQKLMIYEINDQRKSMHNNKKSNNQKKDSTQSNKKHQNQNGNKKTFRNEYKKHGGHEWDDCHSNFKNEKKSTESRPTKKEEANETKPEWKSSKRHPKHEKKEEKHHITRRSGRSRHSRHRHRRRYSDSSESSTWSDTSYSLYEIFEEVELMNIEEAYLRDSDDVGNVDSMATPDRQPTLSSELLISIPATHGDRVFTALIDSGCSKSLDNKAILQSLEGTEINEKRLVWQTKAGKFETFGKGKIKEFCLPQFAKKRRVGHVFHAFKKNRNDSYDFILGRDFMQKIVLGILNSKRMFHWNGIDVMMIKAGHWTGRDKRSNVRQFKFSQELQEARKIIESKYEKADLEQVVQELVHLKDPQKMQLLKVMWQYVDLFQGRVGKWTGEPVDIKLKPGVTPYHTKAYRMPQAYMKLFKDEIDRLVEIGTLSPVTETEWASPTFCTPKKDQRIRIVSDFRILNSCIFRSPWPTPNIQEIFQDIGGFHFVTAIDLSMRYYAMALTPRARELCTIILP